jgi:hypothetical protein
MVNEIMSLAVQICILWKLSNDNCEIQIGMKQFLGVLLKIYIQRNLSTVQNWISTWLLTFYPLLSSFCFHPMIFFSNELPCLEFHFGGSYAEHRTKVRDGATKLVSADLHISTPHIYFITFSHDPIHNIFSTPIQPLTQQSNQNHNNA